FGTSQERSSERNRVNATVIRRVRCDRGGRPQSRLTSKDFLFTDEVDGMAECSMSIYERSSLRFRLFPGDRASAAQTDWLDEFALQAVEFDCSALPERI
ncbi:MAG: hypothetical protein K0Q61_4187, partial [Rhodococcus erythropolis]|nr:hypothetical protein [Rhodococcus erythropolis]